MLAAAGYKVHVGGNIGTPLIDRLDEVQPGEPVVLELSSFQLELFTPQLAWGDVAGVGPDVAGLLNLTPNHLDRHPDMP
jgi:UDP-N-acetylmuramoylalanine--D-glutamate ligase